MYVVYIDKYHLGDVLFLRALGVTLAGMAKERRPVVVLHGPGEFTERALEAEGVFLDGGDVAALNDAQHRDSALRAIRELNQRLVNIFTEALAPAISIDPSTQRLLVEAGGRVERRRHGWLEGLTSMPSIPVMSSTASSDSGPSIAEDGQVIGSFLTDEPVVTPILFTKTSLPGIMAGKEPVTIIAPDDPRIGESITRTEVLEMLTLARSNFLITNASGPGAPGRPRGTTVSFNASDGV